MFFKQIQRQKLLQKLSPQQIQLMKLLQVPTANLEDRIREELEANPALEAGPEILEKDEFSSEDEYEYDDTDDLRDRERENEQLDEYIDMDLSDYMQEDDAPGWAFSSATDEDNDNDPMPIKEEDTLYDHLKNQFGILSLTDQQQQIVEQIIGNIDEDGYLQRATISIVDDLAFKRNLITTEEEVEKLIHLIQGFDPPGIAARDLQECLLIQLGQQKNPKEEDLLAKTIIEKHFDAFTKKHYKKIKKQLKLSDETLKKAIEVILSLTPRPGAAFNHSDNDQNYIIPDFFIRNNNGELELNLNARNAPHLHISQQYREMFEDYDTNKKKSREEKEVLLFVKQKIDSAKWFIEAIKQRQETLLLTMMAIMDYQKDFFLTGDTTNLRPMILKDIAEVIKMDISTVSRVANSKYVQTEFGVFLLKYFFSEGITNSEGEEVSTHEVKTILQEIVTNENKKKPYSDQALTILLKEKGYPIARRTVAKYREQLNIPVARLRKKVGLS